MKLKHLRTSAYTITPPDHPDIYVEGGAVFEVDDAVGENLLLQEDNYERADTPAKRTTKQED